MATQATKTAELSIVGVLWLAFLSSCAPSLRASSPKEATSMSPVSVRYMVDDVDAAVAFYTTHLGFRLEANAAPAFASVTRGNLRLLLSGKTSSGARPMPDGRQPVPGGWNRIQLPVTNLATEVTRLRDAGLEFRNDIVKGVGGSQIVLDDPFGNPIELWQGAR